MADVSQLKATDGTVYNIKDAQARQDIANLRLHDYLGETTSNISDGSTTNPITIDGQSVTVEKGDTVTKGNKEFLWSGTAWKELGDLSDLGSLAYKNSASGSFTPAGSVTVTPAGGVATNANIYEISGVGSLPSATVASGTEVMEFKAGALPTRQSKSVTTSVSAVTATASFSGTAGTVTVS